MPTLPVMMPELSTFDRACFSPPFEPCLASRPNVRRCLFPTDAGVKARTDQWLNEMVLEMQADAKLQSLKWGFDFENDVPLPKNANASVASLYELVPIDCRDAPEFYTRPPHVKTKPTFDLVANDRTPSKKRTSSCVATIAESSVAPCINETPFTSSILGAAHITDWTPNKPLSTTGEVPQAPNCSPSTSSSTQVRRKSSKGEQTELTHYFPHKRSRRTNVDKPISKSQPTAQSVTSSTGSSANGVRTSTNSPQLASRLY